MATTVGKNARGGIAKVGKNTKKSNYTDFSGNTVAPKTTGGSARGDDFAGSASGNIGIEDKAVSTAPRTKEELQSSTFRLAGGGGPTVMSNADKIERVVPLLNSRANNLSSFNLSADSGAGGANFTGAEDTVGATGDETGDEFDQLLGFDPNAKKKKKEEIVYTPFEQQQLDLLTQMQKTQDKRLRQSLSQTRQAFNQREREQMDATQAGLRNLRQVLSLAGSSRYAPISSQGIISAGEAAGIKALADLDALEQKTVAEIQEARDTLDYQTLEKKFNFLDGLRKEKQVAADKLDEEVKTRQEELTKDNALGGLIAQGITDPVEMLNLLNYNEAGELVGDFTLSDITSRLNDINGVAKTASKNSRNLFDDKTYLKLASVPGMNSTTLENIIGDLNAGFSLDEVLGNLDATPEELQAVKDALGVSDAASKPVTVGKGATSPLEENLIRTRLFSKIAPILNKGTLSDSDREIIDTRISEFRDAGMGEQEILDAIAGLPPEVTSPYNNMFRDLIVSNSETTEKQTQAIGKLAMQIQRGNYTQAMNEVENMALNNAKKLDPDNYIGTATTKNYLEKGQKLLKLVTDAEDIIGPLEGTWETVKGKLAKSKNNKAAEISANIAALVAQMRNDLSGTAVTASEAEFLEPLIPSLSDRIDNFSTKVRALTDNALNQYNTVRSTVSLPEVTAEQVIEPKKRLMLYSNDIYVPAEGELDI